LKAKQKPERPLPRPYAQLLDEIREMLWTFTVYVFRVDGERPSYAGTASCVAAGGTPHLLTAAHVWKVLHGDCFALGLKEDWLLMPVRKDIVLARLFGGSPSDEWGPDLALIRLPSLAARDIGREKAFYDLDRQRTDPVLAGERDDCWALIGAPAEQATFRPTESMLRLTLFDSWTKPHECERGGFDYRDVTLDRMRRRGLPQSYKGISGSGLWRIPIARSGRQIAWTREVRLEGVAFFQIPAPAPRQIIRCHGRKSILIACSATHDGK
jgi:hypothetical protein